MEDNFISKLREYQFRNRIATPYLVAWYSQKFKVIPSWMDKYYKELKSIMKPTGKTKVARFPIAYNGSYGIERNPYMKLHNNSFYTKITSGVVKLSPKHRTPYGATGSYALAYVSGYGWYSKAGCCQSIRGIGQGGNVTYFIPNVLPLSLGKKIAYINELSSMFGDRIKYIGIQKASEGLTATDSLSNATHKAIPTFNNNASGSGCHIWVNCEDWLVVEVSNVPAIDNLLFLQFLRPLYQFSAVSVLFNYHRDDDSFNTSTNYNFSQPHVYFRLKRMYPELDKKMLLWLSFVSHGMVNNSTYFPIVRWRYGFKNFDYSKTKTTISRAESNGIISAFCIEFNSSLWKFKCPPKFVSETIDYSSPLIYNVNPNEHLEFDDKLLNTNRNLSEAARDKAMSTLSVYMMKNFLLGKKENFDRILWVLGNSFGYKELLNVLDKK